MLVSFILLCIWFGQSVRNVEASNTPTQLQHEQHLRTQQLEPKDRTTSEVSITEIPTAAPILIDYWPTDPVPSTIGGPSMSTPSPSSIVSSEPTSFSVVIGVETPTLLPPTAANVTPPAVENTQNGTIKTTPGISVDSTLYNVSSKSPSLNSLSSTSSTSCYHRSVTFQQIVAVVIMSSLHFYNWE